MASRRWRQDRRERMASTRWRTPGNVADGRAGLPVRARHAISQGCARQARKGECTPKTPPTSTNGQRCVSHNTQRASRRASANAPQQANGATAKKNTLKHTHAHHHSEDAHTNTQPKNHRRKHRHLTQTNEKKVHTNMTPGTSKLEFSALGRATC